VPVGRSRLPPPPPPTTLDVAAYWALSTTFAVLLALAHVNAVQALHAQAKPPAYVVAEIDVTNAESYDKEYVPPAAKAIADAGGKYVVRGGRTVAIFGEPPKPRIAVMVFESMEKAKAAFDSSAYKEARRWETNTRNSAFMPWKACRNSWSYQKPHPASEQTERIVYTTPPFRFHTDAR